MTGKTQNNFSFIKKSEDRLSSVYEFSDSKNKHIISLNRTTCSLGSKSGFTHDVSWGVIKDDEVYFDGSTNEDLQFYINTVFSIFDDYFSEIQSETTSHYLRGDFIKNKMKMKAKSLFENKYGTGSTEDINGILFIKVS